MMLHKNIFGYLTRGWKDRGKQAYYHNEICEFCGADIHVATNTQEEKRVLYCPQCMFVKEEETTP